MRLTGSGCRVAMLVGIVVAAAGFASAALAVKTFATGIVFMQQDASYQHGYVAGALDMVAVLQDAGFIAPAHNEEAKRVVACGTSKPLDEAVIRLVRSLERTKKFNDNAASSLYATMRRPCR